MIKITGDRISNLPWADRPADSQDVVWRYNSNPIIGRNAMPSAGRIYNSAVIAYNGEFIGVFRVDGLDGMPLLHLGYSVNGIDWKIDEAPIRFTKEDGTVCRLSYAYDPRLVKIENSYYIIWCNDYYGPTIGIAQTKDFKTFVQLENAFLPFNRNGVLFPRKINGDYILLSRPSDKGHTPFGDIFLSRSQDLVHWGRHRRVMEASTWDWWQNLKIGAGPVPIETSEGWLLFYHGVTGNCSGYVYSMGAVLLDLDNPEKVILRSKGYLLTPEVPYESIGQVPNVIFPCAALSDAESGRIAVYYGAADSCVAMAFTQIDELYNYMKVNSRINAAD